MHILCVTRGAKITFGLKLEARRSFVGVWHDYWSVFISTRNTLEEIGDIRNKTQATAFL